MEIIDLPIEIQELVEKRRTSSCDNLDGAFVWQDAPEKQFFWNEIDNGNFEPFYKLYPKNQTKNILNEYADDILNAMNEYAEQESIAFAEWTSQNLKWQKKSKKDLWLNNETLSVVTTKELYHIFKNNQ